MICRLQEGDRIIRCGRFNAFYNHRQIVMTLSSTYAWRDVEHNEHSYAHVLEILIEGN